MARTKKQVDSTEVREWANETNWRDELDRPVADRGRMPSGLIEAYNKANARYNKEYVPIPRPVRADSRGDSAPAPRQRSAQATSTRNANSDAGTREATTQAVAATAPASGEGSVQSLQDVIAMLTATESKKGGRKAVVTIQTLVDLPA